MIRYILLQKYRFNNIYHYYNIINIKYILYFYQQEILEISIHYKQEKKLFKYIYSKYQIKYKYNTDIFLISRQRKSIMININILFA